MMCSYWKHQMVWTKKQASKDQYVWKYQTKNCFKYKTTLSLRTNLFLAISSISLQSWLDILYRWSNEESITIIQRSLTIFKPPMLKVFKGLRNCIFRYLKEIL